MNREKILEELERYCYVQELVCPHTYERFWERSWQCHAPCLVLFFVYVKKMVYLCTAK